MKTRGIDQDRVGHDDVRNFYDHEYYASPYDRHPLAWHMRSIANRLGDLENRQVLDIACGTGQWLGELARRGAKPSGIDISSRAVELCRDRLPAGDIREGVAEALPFADGTFDLVTCLGSLEHFLDQPAALREMRRVAKPDAQFLILVPNSGFLTRRLGLYRGTGQVAIRETVRSLEDWRRMLEGAGLEVRARWRDLHPLSKAWILQAAPGAWPLRALQALLLAVWPIGWQYQVYFLCRRSRALREAMPSSATEEMSG
ncbi:class I SAM-dependent methyltransferase [Luteimonas vadosa]|uniref:Methyltransferase type 11 domain-containing protein n=1 Tax=Luteimonas vadosa TaxID=1165507 RepID=A0ABP9DTG6_9GAMM